MEFDPDGRIWVVEMRGYMPNIQGTDEDAPVGRIVVLEDENNDGQMDKSTVFWTIWSCREPLHSLTADWL